MERDEFLEGQGYQVMRFRNEEFAGDIALVMITIRNALETPSPCPLPR
jgi:very-short-patch-repair endonuclease